MWECKFCFRKISNKGSFSAHEKCCHQNPNRVKHKRSSLAGRKKGCTPWNKGKKTNHTPWNKGLVGIKGCIHSEKTKLRLSEVAKSRKLGGYIKGSGRGKKGWFKGIFCDSSWELAYVIYCLDHEIPISRNTDRFYYSWKDKIRIYIPDFEVYSYKVEIKGYVTDQWKAKFEQNPKVFVLKESDLKNIFRYVIDKYGKDFIKLYEKEDRVRGVQTALKAVSSLRG